MNKKILSMVIIFILSFLLIAQDWYSFRDVSNYYSTANITYKTIKTAYVYDDKKNIITIKEANSIFSSSSLAGITYEENSLYGYADYLIGYENNWISADDVVINNSAVFPDYIITNNSGNLKNKRWIPVWYNDAISADNPRKVIQSKSSWLQRYPGWEEDGYTYPCLFSFRNIMLSIRLQGPSCEFKIINIKNKDNVYYIECKPHKNCRNSYLHDESLYNFPDINVNQIITLKMELSGNRIKLYNGDNNKLIVELMQVTPEWIELLQKYLETGIKPAGLKPCAPIYNKPVPNDTALLSIPSSPLSVVTVNKRYRASDNLRLRSSGSTAGKPVITIGKGTQVKVLAVGAEQTIDGITSNWVQVEVQTGAKDRDGKPIAAGTRGWCFGGYLAER